MGAHGAAPLINSGNGNVSNRRGGQAAEDAADPGSYDDQRAPPVRHCITASSGSIVHARLDGQGLITSAGAQALV
jgi:hypothetical protein